MSMRAECVPSRRVRRRARASGTKTGHQRQFRPLILIPSPRGLTNEDAGAACRTLHNSHTSWCNALSWLLLSTLSGLRRRLRCGAEAASPLAAHLSQRGERVAKGGAVQATRGRRGRQRQRRCCCGGGGRHGLGLPRRRHCPGGARTLLDSGTHLGLGLGFRMRVRVEASGFGLHTVATLTVLLTIATHCLPRRRWRGWRQRAARGGRAARGASARARSGRRGSSRT